MQSAARNADRQPRLQNWITKRMKIVPPKNPSAKMIKRLKGSVNWRRCVFVHKKCRSGYEGKRRGTKIRNAKIRRRREPNESVAKRKYLRMAKVAMIMNQIKKSGMMLRSESVLPKHTAKVRVLTKHATNEPKNDPGMKRAKVPVLPVTTGASVPKHLILLHEPNVMHLLLLAAQRALSRPRTLSAPKQALNLCALIRRLIVLSWTFSHLQFMVKRTRKDLLRRNLANPPSRVALRPLESVLLREVEVWEGGARSLPRCQWEGRARAANQESWQ
mmetsp:Transcript_18900/g.45350  ORF Transcript_18900/g.45350 Transcript_18900/m.45350 type:complete len:274 (+) Transcript_18900:2605-3426(+)